MLEINADDFRKLGLFQKLVDSSRRAQVKKYECDNIPTSQVTKHAVKLYFEMWQVRTEVKRSQQLEERLHVFQSKKSKHTKRKYFRLMKNRFHLYNDILLKKSETLYRRHLGGLLYDSVLRKLEIRSSQLEGASQIYSKNTLQSMFRMWVERYNKYVELQEILDENTDQQNIDILSSYLSVWSMKLMKVSRNNQSIEAFRTRWDRANLRGFISLWKEKYEEKQHVQNEIHRDDAATLAHETPQRPTAANQDTIRGSVSVRKNKLNAMINRYRNVGRAIPSPIKNEGDNRRSILNRVSPLRKTQLDFQNMAVLRPSSPHQTPIQLRNRARIETRYTDDDRYLNGSPRGKQI